MFCDLPRLLETPGGGGEGGRGVGGRGGERRGRRKEEEEGKRGGGKEGERVEERKGPRTNMYQRGRVHHLTVMSVKTTSMATTTTVAMSPFFTPAAANT